MKPQNSNSQSSLSKPWKKPQSPFPSLGKDRDQRSEDRGQRAALQHSNTPSLPSSSSIELLAPGGDRDAALAALHYGADALYCGLQKFSARAEATNFDSEQLGELVAYAHSLAPRRRVFVTVNTVVLERERAGLLETLDALDEIGVDAIIVQDLGVLRLARRFFPRLALHASTQLAVHNLAGAEALRELGFKRVTLARELTLDEIGAISVSCGIETEVFIHGALCYCYSGLCLYSSQLRGRSGNRGRCAYPCRDMFKASGDKQEASSGFAFSMKDLALPEQVEALHAAGVASMKIEGRKKTALYVGATVDYYRRQLDGALPPGEAAARQEDLRTIFARPWTNLYAGGRSQRGVVDSELVGHRGAAIGRVESVIAHGHGTARLRFKTARTLERHDGLQIDIPGGGKPFGFPIDALRVGGKNVITASAGALVEVELPREHPQIPLSAQIYCSSSQAVKRSFPFPRPKPGAFKHRQKISVTCVLAPDKVTAQVEGGVAVELSGAFQPAKDAARMEAAARGAFEKLGDTNFELGAFALQNPQGLFAPVSLLNELRRILCVDLGAVLATQATERLARLRREADAEPAPVAAVTGERWLLKIDRPAYLDAFEPEDWRDVEEISVAAEVEPLPDLLAGLERLAGTVGREKIRLALPVITRRWEEQDLLARVTALRAAGWQKWEAANISAWSLLGTQENLNLATDWPLYTLNSAAAAQLFAMGVLRVTFSPEDGFDNIRELLPKLGERAAVIVFQDTPLFIAETCPVASLSGECPGPSACQFKELEMVSDAGEHVLAVNR
ncbi:MAG: U32 family peptidase, partial [Kiritimatiellaeota bacterium]|nr:U32 family peptidase [Kiritimatiellota bacterium]